MLHAARPDVWARLDSAKQESMHGFRHLACKIFDPTNSATQAIVPRVQDALGYQRLQCESSAIHCTPRHGPSLRHAPASKVSDCTPFFFLSIQEPQTSVCSGGLLRSPTRLCWTDINTKTCDLLLLICRRTRCWYTLRQALIPASIRDLEKKVFLFRAFAKCLNADTALWHECKNAEVTGNLSQQRSISHHTICQAVLQKCLWYSSQGLQTAARHGKHEKQKMRSSC